ncbi:endonuclease V [Thermodesulfobacteriota bacterium]
MLACLDVGYRQRGAGAACVLFGQWQDREPASVAFTTIDSPIPPYVPGAFYLRELPCLLAVLETLDKVPNVLVVDGYVWLSKDGTPGLGAHLQDAVGAGCSVIGVAKRRRVGDTWSRRVLRGSSSRPLFATSAGVDEGVAVACIRSMHGKYRIPTLLRAADRLCREACGGGGECACYRGSGGNEET